MHKNEEPKVDPKIHARILRFLNAARSPEELMKRPRDEFPLHDKNMGHRGHKDEPEEELKDEPLLDKKLAMRVFEEREKISPIYGFEHIRQLLRIRDFNLDIFGGLIRSFGAGVKGDFETLYASHPLSETPIEVIGAALLRTGSVLFIEEAYGSDTLIWDPEDTNPTTAFRVLSGAATGLGSTNLACSGHSFLTDGRLLAVGGDSPTSKKGWKFDPEPGVETWTRTLGDGTPGNGDMAVIRWYPTAVTLGDDDGRVFIVNGATSNSPNPQSEVEIYSEDTDSFSRVWGPGGPGDTSADRPFPKLYAGLHLTRNGQIFHTRVGENRSGSDPKSAYFTFSGFDRGSWTTVTDNTTDVTRIEGMSALMLGQEPTDPDRVLVVGGGDAATTQKQIGIVDLPATTTTPWLSGSFPDGLSRREVSTVLLPDGTAFICGGRPASGSPTNGGASMLYRPPIGAGAGTLSVMDTLEYARQHHTVALLLPSARVMVTGGSSEKIEVFSPPYLFTALGAPIAESDRPDISSYPDPDAGQSVLHSSTFTIGTTDPGDVARVVLVRPMAVTHHTDTEQRVLRLTSTVSGPGTLGVSAPGGWVYPYGAGATHSHAIAGRGYYMLFLLNTAGIPSRAKFIKLV